MGRKTQRAIGPHPRRAHLVAPRRHVRASMVDEYCLHDGTGALLGIILQPRSPLVFGRTAPTVFLRRSCSQAVTLGESAA